MWNRRSVESENYVTGAKSVFLSADGELGRSVKICENRNCNFVTEAVSASEPEMSSRNTLIFKFYVQFRKLRCAFVLTLFELNAEHAW